MKEGIVRERLGRYGEALRWYADGLREADGSTKMELEIAYAGVLYRQAHYDDCIAWCKIAAQHADAIGDRRAIAHTYYLIDAAYNEIGHFDPTWCEQALAIYEELDDPEGEAEVLIHLGIHAYYAGRWDEALAFYTRGRKAKERSDNAIGIAIGMNNEAEVLSDQGHLGRADELFQEALRIFRVTGYTLGERFVIANRGRLAARASRFDEAHALLDDAATKLRAIGSEGLALEADVSRVETFVLEGRHAEALELAEHTLARVKELGRTVLSPRLERLLGYALHQGGQRSNARRHFAASLRRAREVNMNFELALTLRAIAETTGASEDGEANEIFAQLGVVAIPVVPVGQGTLG
jgi:tetratricopeptide (TPR) repeat protein